MYFWDPTWVVVIPAFLFALAAQAKVQSTFSHFMRIRASSGVTGSEVARRLLDRAGLSDVVVEQIPRRLGDHYDPRVKRLRLSPEVYGGSSIAALGVAAHETGHAMQHSTNYLPLALRSSLVPVASLGSSLAIPLFFLGWIMASPWLMNLGIWVFVGVVAFQAVTLPVEFNASRRAIELLESEAYLSPRELEGARSVLSAAALTYVAAMAVALTQLLRLLLLRGRRDD